MGLLDALFGGGTKLDLKLDTNMIPEGGTLSGTVTLSGGKKPLKLTALKVKLLYVKVTPVEGQAMPKIDLQVLLDNTVIANQDLPPASLNKYSFSFAVPTGTDPKGTYKVVATADIPSVKDPSAEAELKVIAPNSGERSGIFGFFKGSPSQEEILGQFQGLMSRDEDELCNALSDLQCAAYDPDKNFVNVQAFLGQKMQSGSERVRSAALAAWGTVLNNRAKPEHIKSLEALVTTPGLSRDMMREAITVVAKFAEEGAWPLVQQLAKHSDPEVRSELASRLYFDAEHDLPGKKELLLAMTDDEDAGVRRAACQALTAFNDDRAIIETVAKRASTDPSPDVQQACISAIALAHHHGMADLVFATFEQALKNPHSSVRKELADCIHWLPADPRLDKLVEALLADSSQEVRRGMAWQACNMSEHPELKPLFLRAATQDPDEEVRGDALGGIDKFMPFPDAIEFLCKRLQEDPTEKTYWGAFNCVKFHDEEPKRNEVLQVLAKGPFTRVAERAREEMNG